MVGFGMEWWEKHDTGGIGISTFKTGPVYPYKGTADWNRSERERTTSTGGQILMVERGTSGYRDGADTLQAISPPLSGNRTWIAS